MKKLLSIIFALVLILSLSACGSQKKEPTKEAKKTLIGISLPTSELQRWSSDGENMKAALEKAGYEVALRYAENDTFAQFDQIGSMINAGCKALIVTPIESDKITTVLDLAKEKGIPVIAYDRLIMNSDAVSYYVTFDNYMVGVKQGEYIEQALNLKEDDGKTYNIEIVSGDEDDNNVNYYYNGAMSVLQPYFDSEKLVCVSGRTTLKDTAISNWETSVAQQTFTAILKACYSDGTALDAVLALNDSVALGVEKALAAAYTGSYPVITGQDCDTENVKNIIAGKQSMSVFKDSRIITAKAAEMVDTLLKGNVPTVNDETTYNNGIKVVKTFLCEPESCDAENYVKVLIESGYYTKEQIE